MTTSYEPYPAGAPDDVGDSSTKETAQQQAQQVAGSAKDQAANVVGTAKEQAQNVTSEVMDQGRMLANEAQSQLMSHATTQRDNAVENLRSIGDELSTMAERADTSGLGVQLVREGSAYTRKAADFLAEREPGQLLDEVRDLARRRPGAFLLGAAIAGLVVGRATRGVVSAHKSSSDESNVDRTSSNGTGTYAVAQPPLAADVATTTQPVARGYDTPVETTTTETFGTTGTGTTGTYGTTAGEPPQPGGTW